eukprot:jgi/Chlat1/7253/Chrsp58S06895
MAAAAAAGVAWSSAFGGLGTQPQLSSVRRASSAAGKARSTVGGGKGTPESLSGAAAPDTNARREWGFATRLLHTSSADSTMDGNNNPFNAVSPPLYQTATFAQPSATEMGPYDYSRSGNPTRTELEQQLARLDGAHRAFAFSSGMAAIAAATRLEIIAGDDIYGGTDRLLTHIVPNSGITVTRVDTTDVRAVEAALSLASGRCAMVVAESPTNPQMRVTDVRALADAAHAAGALLLFDNSIMSPALCQPLALGADIVMHSATKFISGHSDVTAGVLAVKEPELARRIYFHQNAEGSALGPFDCWLLLRGLKTMWLRVRQQQENAQKVAEFLASHPLIKRVNYPGLRSHSGYDLHFRQCSGAGSVLSFTTGDLDVSKRAAEALRLFKITVSFGSVTSLVSLPCFMSHAAVSAQNREARGLSQDLVRLSIGIEDVEDLIDDLDNALRVAAK